MPRPLSGSRTSAVASLRPRTPSLAKIEVRWLFTVLSATSSLFAISLVREAHHDHPEHLLLAGRENRSRRPARATRAEARRCPAQAAATATTERAGDACSRATNASAPASSAACTARRAASGATTTRQAVGQCLAQRAQVRRARAVELPTGDDHGVEARGRSSLPDQLLDRREAADRHEACRLKLAEEPAGADCVLGDNRRGAGEHGRARGPDQPALASSASSTRAPFCSSEASTASTMRTTSTPSSRLERGTLPVRIAAQKSASSR